MKKIIPQTLKGFRDFLPKNAATRNYIIDKIKKVFERYGFEPLETPALEYAEVLLGKYGKEADKLLYLFTDRGGRRVGLRYDQTVPLSRVVAQYSELPKPFKRYQIQPVWRADNPQSGRYREFLQCDIDVVGSDSWLSDAEIIACTLSACRELGFKDAQMWINDRTIFDNLGLNKNDVIILDKLEKIGKEAVVKELTESGRSDAGWLLETLMKSEPTERLVLVFKALVSMGFKEQKDFQFVPNLARGLEYYTSTVFELKIGKAALLSLAGGGRYDRLIGSFMNYDVPAVGIAFGFDRMVNYITENNLLQIPLSTTDILVTIFSPQLLKDSLETVSLLRSEGFNAEIYLDPNTKLDKQLKYADQKSIPVVIIMGPDEIAKNMLTLKDLRNKNQETVDKSNLLSALKRLLNR